MHIDWSWTYLYWWSKKGSLSTIIPSWKFDKWQRRC